MSTAKAGTFVTQNPEYNHTLKSGVEEFMGWCTPFQSSTQLVQKLPLEFEG